MLWMADMVEFALGHEAEIAAANTKRVGCAVNVVYERNGQREEKRVLHPDRWLMMARAVRDYYAEDARVGAFLESRYGLHEDWREACARLGVSKDGYYKLRAEVIHMAELFAVYHGAVAPSDCRM